MATTNIKEIISKTHIKTMKKDIKSAKEERLAQRKVKVLPIIQTPKDNALIKQNLLTPIKNLLQTLTKQEKGSEESIVKSLPIHVNQPPREQVKVSPIEPSPKLQLNNKSSPNYTENPGQNRDSKILEQKVESTHTKIVKEFQDNKLNTQNSKDQQSKKFESLKNIVWQTDKPIQDKKIETNNLQKLNQITTRDKYREAPPSEEASVPIKETMPTSKKSPTISASINEKQKKKFIEDIEDWISSHNKFQS